MAVVTKRPPRIRPTGAMVAGLPTYSKSQFKLVRPEGNYQKYLKYIKTRRGVEPGPKWPGRGGPGLPTYESLIRQIQFQNPRQMEAQANRMAAQQVAAQKAIMAEEWKQQGIDAIRRHDAMAAAGRAAASLNAGLFGAVGGEYNAAAREIQNLATSGASAAQAATQAGVDVANAQLANVGAPGVEAAGVMAGPGQAGVEAYVGGTLPAQNFATQGQAATFGLAGMVNAQNLRATQEAAAGLMQATGDIQRQRTAALKELAAGRPAQAAQYLQQLQEAQRQQIALAMSLIEARRNAQNRGFEQGIQKINTRREGVQLQSDLKTAAANRALAERNARLQERQQRLAEQEARRQGRQVDADRSVALGYYVDARGNAIKKNGKRIPVPKTVTTKATGTPVPQQMAEAADQWIYRHTSRRGGITGTKAQLIAYLTAIYGNRAKATQIANSTFPGGAGKANAGFGGVK